MMDKWKKHKHLTVSDRSFKHLKEIDKIEQNQENPENRTLFLIANKTFPSSCVTNQDWKKVLRKKMGRKKLPQI